MLTFLAMLATGLACFAAGIWFDAWLERRAHDKRAAGMARLRKMAEWKVRRNGQH